MYEIFITRRGNVALLDEIVLYVGSITTTRGNQILCEFQTHLRHSSVIVSFTVQCLLSN